MRLLSTVAVLLMCVAAQAADHPSWETLQKLLGQPTDAAAVSEVVNAHRLSHTTKGPSGMFTPDDYAYTLLYRQNRISSIQLRVAPRQKESSEPHWRPYGGTLPADLSAGDGRAEVSMTLGKPIENRKDTWRHGNLYIWVHFNEAEGAIDELYVSQRIIEAASE